MYLIYGIIQLIQTITYHIQLFQCTSMCDVLMQGINIMMRFNIQETQYKQLYNRMTERWIPTKPNFGAPPPGYIAGLGRGATGFVTRSELGPAARANLVQAKQSQADDAAYSDARYDSWQGYKGALFSKQQLDQQDKQADEAFDFCERKMEQRRLKQKQIKMKEQLQKQQKQKKNIHNTSISEQFTDLKRQLAKVTAEEWMNLPESADLSIKKRKKQKYTPVPDSMILSYLTSNTNRAEVQTDANQIYRQTKQIQLKSNLQKAENQVGAKSGVDRIGYLTQMDKFKVDQEMIGDVKRARLLHKAALASNPKNADIWLSSARIQQIDGKIQQCRNILHKALEHCPMNQDIWIQLARVQRAQQSKNVLVQALRNLPKNQKIWLAVARKEQANKQMKSKVIRKGLQNLPQSTRLWKQLIELSDLSQAKNLLYKAVECLPHQIDLWVGLAKLQTYQNAKQVLNKARKANPLNLAIWINAAKLQQSQYTKHQEAVNKIQNLITKSREILKKNGNTVSRQQYLQEALICERSDNLITCQSIIKSVISLGLTEEELNHSIFKDVQLFERQFQSLHTTRFLYKYGIQKTQNPKLFEQFLQFQQRLAVADLRDPSHKKSQILESLQFGLKVFPHSIQFWLAMIDRLIDHKKYDQAEKVIQTAIKNMKQQQKERLLLCKVQIFKRTDKLDDARNLLRTLRQTYQTSSLSAIQTIWLEYHTQNYEQAWKICSQLFKKEIKNEQIWELALKIKSKIGSYEQCKNIAEKAVNEHPKCIKLWKLYTQVELKYKFQSKARTIIDKALMKNPKNQQLYLILIGLELASGNKKQISTTLAKALKQCPKSGQIWGIAIIMQAHNTRKKKASVAIQQCGTNSSINCAVAKLFWKDNKIDKARKWLQDAIHTDKTNGDIWAYYYKLIKQQFPSEAQKVLSEFIEIGKVTHGRKWMKIKEESSDGWKLNQSQILSRVVNQIGDEIHNIE